MSEKIAKKSKNSGPSLIGKSYLLAYNGIQTVGWSYLLLHSAIHFLNRGTLETFWPEIKTILTIFQNAALLEVVHAAIGLVPSGVMVVLLQVYSRMFVVCGVLLSTDSAPVSPGLPLCIIAWSITEIVRYAYYTFNLLKTMPQILLFLRYTTFLVLYPLGVTGELLCMYYCLDEVAEKKLFTISLPNAWNFSFNYYYIIIITMSMYVPLFPLLFNHMLAQRRKMLGPKKIG